VQLWGCAVLGGAPAYTDALFAFSIIGWIAAVYAIAATLPLRSEEVENHVAHLLQRTI